PRLRHGLSEIRGRERGKEWLEQGSSTALVTHHRTFRLARRNVGLGSTDLRIGPIADAARSVLNLIGMAVCNEQAMAKQESPGETPGLYWLEVLLLTP
ncbi:MAG: hypothetical protein WA769_11395, partial [Pseudolabrys sp.]